MVACMWCSFECCYGAERSMERTAAVRPEVTVGEERAKPRRLQQQNQRASTSVALAISPLAIMATNLLGILVASRRLNGLVPRDSPGLIPSGRAKLPPTWARVGA